MFSVVLNTVMLYKGKHIGVGQRGHLPTCVTTYILQNVISSAIKCKSTDNI
jgi:hypothetical protein